MSLCAGYLSGREYERTAPCAEPLERTRCMLHTPRGNKMVPAQKHTGITVKVKCLQRVCVCACCLLHTPRGNGMVPAQKHTGILFDSRLDMCKEINSVCLLRTPRSNELMPARTYIGITSGWGSGVSKPLSVCTYLSCLTHPEVVPGEGFKARYTFV